MWAPPCKKKKKKNAGGPRAPFVGFQLIYIYTYTNSHSAFFFFSVFGPRCLAQRLRAKCDFTRAVSQEGFLGQPHRGLLLKMAAMVTLKGNPGPLAKHAEKRAALREGKEWDRGDREWEWGVGRALIAST